MLTLSEEIRQCREGVVRNPHQGPDKRVLFVCSMGLLRSATGARIYADKFNTRTAGVWADALTPLTPILVAWADEIVFVYPETHRAAVKKFGQDAFNHTNVVVLNIPDMHPHMHPELVKAFDEQYYPSGYLERTGQKVGVPTDANEQIRTD